MASQPQKLKESPYLRIELLTKLFGSFAVLKDVDLKVYKGELTCFLGPSGCGKTTLLRCIAWLNIQTSGRVIQAGKDIRPEDIVVQGVEGSEENAFEVRIESTEFLGSFLCVNLVRRDKQDVHRCAPGGRRFRAAIYQL